MWVWRGVATQGGDVRREVWRMLREVRPSFVMCFLIILFCCGVICLFIGVFPEYMYICRLSKHGMNSEWILCKLCDIWCTIGCGDQHRCVTSVTRCAVTWPEQSTNPSLPFCSRTATLMVDQPRCLTQDGHRTSRSWSSRTGYVTMWRLVPFWNCDDLGFTCDVSDQTRRDGWIPRIVDRLDVCRHRFDRLAELNYGKQYIIFWKQHLYMSFRSSVYPFVLF